MYIYILKNKTTNKKYIGYTTQNIETYLGSGMYWKKHCKSNGGYNSDNIEKIWYEWYDDKLKALEFLNEFEKNNPEYWKSDKWANLIAENLESSPFKGNMDSIFERNGNPFSGGEVQSSAWASGKYDKRNQSKASKKGWLKRDKIEAVDKMTAGYQKWMNENSEYFLEQQRVKLKRAAEVRRNKLIKLEYNGKIYRGWSELSRATGKSKWFLKKDPMVKIL